MEKFTTGAGADTFKFAASDVTAYTLDGGAGTDTLNFSNVSLALTVALNAAGGSIGSTNPGQYGSSTFSNIEKIIGGSGVDNITVNSADTTAYTIEGGKGNDNLDGGAGYSTLSYANSSAAVQFTINNMSGNSAGGEDADNFSHFSKFEGSGSGDTFTLTSGDTTPYNLKGLGGADTFMVGEGNKATIDGGALADNDTLNFVNTSSKVALAITAVGTGTAADQHAGLVNFSNIKTFVGGAVGTTFSALASDTTGYTFKSGSGNDSVTGSGGADTIDFRTNNISLANASVNAGAGADTVIVNQDKLGSASINLDGGTTFRATVGNIGADTSNDTLVVYKGTATAALDLTSLKATNFEILDVSADGSSSSVTLTSAGIRSLVNNGDSSILTLKLGTSSTNDAFTISTVAGETFTQGQNVKFFDASNHQIAQVNFTYV